MLRSTKRQSAGSVQGPTVLGMASNMSSFFCLQDGPAAVSQDLECATWGAWCFQSMAFSTVACVLTCNLAAERALVIARAVLLEVAE